MPAVTVTPREFQFELGYEPIKRWRLGQEPQFQWKNFILAWEDAGVNFDFVPATPAAGALKFSTGGGLSLLGTFQADLMAKYEKFVVPVKRISVYGETGGEFHGEPNQEPALGAHFIQNVGIQQYNLMPNSTEQDEKFSAWKISGGLHDLSVGIFQARVQTPWQWWEDRFSKGGFGEIGLEYRSERPDGKPLTDPRPEGLEDHHTFRLDARAAFDVARPQRRDSSGSVVESTDIKVIADGSIARNWDEGRDNDDAIYSYNAETDTWGNTDFSAADTTSVHGGAQILITRGTGSTLPPHLRDFVLKPKKATIVVGFALDAKHYSYGGPYYIRTDGVESSICDNSIGSAGLYTETEATQSTFGRARGSVAQCQLSRDDVALSWSIGGDFVSLISPRFRLGGFGDLTVTPSFGMKTWVTGPSKGRTDFLLGAEFAIDTIKGRTR